MKNKYFSTNKCVIIMGQIDGKYYLDFFSKNRIIEIYVDQSQEY